MFLFNIVSDNLFHWKNPGSSKRKISSLRLIGISLLIVLFSGAPVLAETGEKLLLQLFNQSKSKVDYVAPSPDQFQCAWKLFKQMLTQSVEKTEMEKQWSDAGYKLHEIIYNDETLWVLSPDTQHTAPYGFFIFRVESSVPLIIQAPHRYHDYYTGLIAVRLFLESQARVGAWNTVHRNKVDFGKEKTSFFHALTLAAVDAKPALSVLQLHGFGPVIKRNGETLVEDIILSNGGLQPSAKLYEISKCLPKFQAIRVAVFPIHVFQLGGTQNIAAKAYQQHDSDQFFHVEMSRTFRKRLRDQKDLRADFLSCFINGG